MAENEHRSICLFLGIQESIAVSEARALLQRLSALHFCRRCCHMCGIKRSGTAEFYARQFTAWIATWVVSGFSKQDVKHTLETIYRCSMLWLHTPTKRRTLRMDRCLWNLAFFCSFALGLHALFSKSNRKHYFRVMLRAFPVFVQTSLLFGSFASHEFEQYVWSVHNHMWDTSPDKSKAANYMLFSSQSSVWYTGKSDINRKCGNKLWFGPVLRFWEHISNTVERSKAQAHRARYRAWTGIPLHALFMVPIAIESTRWVFRFENLVIHVLRAPTQQGKRDGQQHEHAGARAFPRFRRKPSLEDELRLNLRRMLSRKRCLFDKFEPVFVSFLELLRNACKQLRISKQMFMQRLYWDECVMWLAVFLSETNTKMDYATVWKKRNPAEYIASLWLACRELPGNKCRVARRKIEYFLRNARLLCPRYFYISVPTESAHMSGCVLHVIACVLNCITQVSSKTISSFFRSHLRIVKLSGPCLDSLVTDHRHASKQFEQTCFDNVPEERKALYRSRSDVVWLPYHWKVPMPTQKCQVLDFVCVQLLSAVSFFGNPRLSTLCRKVLQATKQVLQYRFREDDLQLLDIVHDLRMEYRNGIFVPLDRDIHRRAVVDKYGYWFRLHECYLNDPRHYKRRADLTPADAAAIKTNVMYVFLDARLHKDVEITADVLPYAYHTYKGKCLHKDKRGLACSRDHAHEREIVSNCKEPLHALLSRSARALRLAKKLADEPTWTLWSQNDIARTVHDRVRKLVVVPAFRAVCPCGKTKPNSLSCAKIDASQFFKDASTDRGRSRTRKFLARLERATGQNAVLVRNGSKADGLLCKAFRKCPKQYVMVTFEDILQCMDFACSDTLFLLGDLVLERTRGYPMGGSFSEPATLVDLGEDTFCLYSDEGQTAQRCGWFIPGIPVESTVQGVQHVDDAAIFSQIWCTDCLFQGTQALWPPDVGTTLEGDSSPVHFLSCDLHIHGATVSVHTHATNLGYARGLQSYQDKSRLGPFLGETVHQRIHLRQFLLGQLVASNYICQGEPSRAMEATISLITECLLLKWPCQWISHTCRSIPRRHDTKFVRSVRILGRLLGKHRVQQQLKQPLFSSIQLLYLLCIAQVR